MAENKNKRPTKEDVEIDRNRVVLEVSRCSERHRTTRTICICMGIVLGIGLVGYWTYHIVNRPMWVEIVSVGLNGLQSVVIWRMWVAKSEYTRRTSRELAEYQNNEDPNRSSTGLNLDGSDPPGA